MMSSIAGPSSVGPEGGLALVYREVEAGPRTRDIGISFPFCSATSSFVEQLGWIDGITTASGCGIADRQFSKTMIPAPLALGEIKEKSGLTWEQLARIFKVTQRSLHLWMDGATLSAENEERLLRLLKTMRGLPYEAPFQNRRHLLEPRGDGTILFDALVEGRDGDIDHYAAEGPVRPWSRGSALTAEERESRKPLPIDVILDADQTTIHTESESGRAE
jgi:hypothetical protein